jgi:hypothetical protein
MAVHNRYANKHQAIAVRAVEFSEPLAALTDLVDYASVRLFVLWQGSPVGSLQINNKHEGISASQLVDAIVCGLGTELPGPISDLSENEKVCLVKNSLSKHHIAAVTQRPERLPTNVSVSVIVPTFDRPDDLRMCLKSLVNRKRCTNPVIE